MEIILSLKDQIDILKYILSLGGTILPGLRWPSQRWPTIKKEDDIEKYHRYTLDKTTSSEKTFKTSMYFAIHDSFYKCPVMIDRLPNGTYWITQRWGGPTIDLDYYSFVINNREKMSPANIEHYPSWVDYRNNNKMIKASKELKEFYQKVIKYAKKDAKRIEFDYKNDEEIIKKIKFWTTASAIESYKKGGYFIWGGHELKPVFPLTNRA